MDQDILNTVKTHESFSTLDRHFARMMSKLADRDTPWLLLASALVSRATSEGHVCLDLAALAGRPLPRNGTERPGISCPALETWRGDLEASGVVGRPGDYRPLILDDCSRLYLQRYWQYEKNLADRIRTRASADSACISRDRLKAGLEKHFPPVQGEAPDWQKVAAFVSGLKRVCVISGGPGTGKSTVIARILALFMEGAAEPPLRSALAAPTGKAAARLQEAVRQGREKMALAPASKEALAPEASTIHRLLGSIRGSAYFRHHAGKPLPVDLVIVDEASMVDLALMAKLMEAIPEQATLILLGDRDQLASVEAGAVLGDICHREPSEGFSSRLAGAYFKMTGEKLPSMAEASDGPALRDCVVELRKSYRFGTESGIGSISRAVKAGDGEGALAGILHGAHDDIAWRALPTPTGFLSAVRERGLEAFKACLDAGDPADLLDRFTSFRILCALRQGPCGVSALNGLVEKILSRENLIPLNRRWYRGRPILITRNDYNLGLFNGDVGLVLPDAASGNELRVFFLTAGGGIKRVLPARLPEHETAYAMTVHKSQGSEFEEALFILPDRDSPVLTRELIYTAMTRARRRVEIWGRKDVFLQAVRRRTRRSSGLRDALWGPDEPQTRSDI